MKNLRFIVINLVVLLGLMGLVEASIAFMLDHPTRIPSSWVNAMRSYYMEKDRKIAQFDTAMAKFDEHLFYRLKPGAHRFSNREFDTELKINSAGFRAEETDVEGPEVIFLGDSYTMGWGTEVEECFPALVGNFTGLKCLNTGISSYGTVRELELFKSLDTSALKFLVIQYDFNDFGENSEYYFNGNSYRPSSESDFEKHVSSQTEAIKYFPFKHISHFVRKWFETHFPAPEEPTEPQAEQPYVDQWLAFINVLKQTSIPKHVVIIVVQVGSEHQQDVFINPLKNNLTNVDSPIGQQILVLDVQKALKDENYYLLDQHLTPSGHAIVADALVSEIKKLQQ